MLRLAFSFNFWKAAALLQKNNQLQRYIFYLHIPKLFARFLMDSWLNYFIECNDQNSMLNKI